MEDNKSSSALANTKNPSEVLMFSQMFSKIKFKRITLDCSFFTVSTRVKKFLKNLKN